MPLTLFSRSHQHFKMSNVDKNKVLACYLLNQPKDFGQFLYFVEVDMRFSLALAICES